MKFSKSKFFNKKWVLDVSKMFQKKIKAQIL